MHDDDAARSISEELAPSELVLDIPSCVKDIAQLRSTRLCAEALIDLKELEEQVKECSDVRTLVSCHHRLQASSDSIATQVALSVEFREKLLNKARTQLQEIVDRIEVITSTSLEDIAHHEARDTVSVAELARSWSEVLPDCLMVYELAIQLPDVINIFRSFVEPLRSRFRYHFESQRPTNRLDKPEWPLQHIIALIEQHQGFALTVFQPALNRAMSRYTLFAPHELIRALLPLIRDNAERTAQQTMTDSVLLDHLLSEVKRFDDVLRSDFGFRLRNLSRWPGLSQELLTDEIFEKWCSYGDSFAKSRYHAIIEEESAFEIIGEVDTTSRDIAPNRSSLKLIDLFEAMTRRYAALEGLSHHQSFVDTIQIVLLDSYLEKIKSSTDAFDELANGFSGGFPSADITGLPGLKRLCRQLSGVSTVMEKIIDWADEPFYIDMNDNKPEAGCFAAQLEGYSVLKERIQVLICSHVEREFSQELRPYVRSQSWASDQIPMTGIATTNTSSPHLIQFYETVNSFFHYLSTITSAAFLHKIYVAVSRSLDRLLWTSVISKNNFSRRGALQLKRDVYQMWATFAQFVLQPEPGMRIICDVLRLLDSVPIEEDVGQMSMIENAVSQDDLRRAGIAVLSNSEVQKVLNSRLF